MLRRRRPAERKNLPRLYWVDDLRPLRLAIGPRPRGGERLAAELRAIADAGVDTLVSLLQDEEMQEAGLGEEAEQCRAIGLGFHRFPIVDHATPAPTDAFVRFVDALVPTLQGHGAIAIHCFAGIGRSSLTAAALLLRCGVPGARIFPALSRARGITVPETTEQALWFRAFAEQNRPGGRS